MVIFNKICLLIVYAIWVTVILLALLCTSSFNPLKSKLGAVQPLIGSFIPQGWGFFTRDPREPRLFIYKQNLSKAWIRDNSQNNFSLHNFGLKRDSRFKMMVLSQALKTIPITKWIAKRDYDKYNVNDVPEITIKNPNLPDFMLTSYLLINKKITPWSWRNFEDKTGMQINLIRVKLVK